MPPSRKPDEVVIDRAAVIPLSRSFPIGRFMTLETGDEVILEIGAELGSSTLLGTRTAHGWRFRSRTIDQSAWLLSDDDDFEGLSYRLSDWVDSWEEALALLDKYPWHRLHPLVVHPEFAQRLWTVVQEKFAVDQSESELARMAFQQWRKTTSTAR
jgi:hypothetical protein